MIPILYNLILNHFSAKNDLLNYMEKFNENINLYKNKLLVSAYMLNKTSVIMIAKWACISCFSV